MKYCIDYNRSSRILELVDEVIIRSDNDINTIVDYIKEHPKQRVIIDITNNDVVLFDKFADIAENNEEDLKFSIRLKKYEKDFDEVIEKYKNSEKVSFFFESFIKDWDTFNGMLELGVSDIYLVENMCFQLDKAAAAAHAKNVQIRVFPNIAQSAWTDCRNFKKFFIRPEDVRFYKNYIDVFEFFGDQKRIDQSVKIYRKGRQWHGLLNELIIDLGEEELDSRFIVRDFAQRRIGCGKKCMWRRSM